MPKEIIKKEKKIKPTVVEKIKTVNTSEALAERSVEGETKSLCPKADKNKEVKIPIKYFEAVGKRKTASARVRLFTDIASSKNKKETFLINKKSLEIYFPTLEAQETIFSPLKEMDCVDVFRVSVKVKGGGVFAQAGAVRHGIAKALMLFNPDFRKKLKKAGFLTRDPRMRERKKFGLKRARRAPQWSKR